MSRDGHLDGFFNDRIYGWAPVGDGEPHLFIDVDIDGRWQVKTIAAIPRTDLVDADGLVFGYGFEAVLPEDAQDGAGHVVRVRRTDTGEELPGSPKALIVPSLAIGHVGQIAGRSFDVRLPGRTRRATSTDVTITVDGEVCSVESLPTPTNPPMPVWQVIRVSLPDHVFDGRRHTIAVTVTGLQLTKQSFQFQSRYLGALDGFEAGLLRGWAVDLSRPDEPLPIEVYLNGRLAATSTADDFQADLAACGYGNGRHAFAIPLYAPAQRLETGAIQVRVRATEFELSRSPNALAENVDFMRFLQAAASALKYLASAAAGPGEKEQADFLNRLLANAAPTQLPGLRRLIPAELRTTAVGRAAFSAEDRLAPVSEDTERGTAEVDVIIPIYKGLRETMNCIDSVLSAACQTPHEVIGVLDNPDDFEMHQRLEQQYAGKITLLKNDRNLGFVKTVNRGMKLHEDRDVLLLNSDTVVYHDWLDRLRRSARSSAEIGTVTPFSNKATICSYPRFVEDNELPADCTGGELDAACRVANGGEIVDIPTAVGFCMYITRECLDAIGYFNEEAFGKGYGEENDFCRRAADSGWRNVMAVDTFVEHLGSVSFQHSKNTLVAKNLQVLNAMYPYYHGMIHDFVSADPIRQWRRRIDIRRLSGAGKPVFCLVCHDFGGGTLAHIEDLSAQLERAGVLVLLLRCSSTGRLSIRTKRLGGIDNLVYDLPADGAQLSRDLLRLGVAHFHYHSNINIPQEVLDLPAVCGVSYDCTVHDYSWLCPRVHLVDETRSYCHEPPVDTCERCISASGGHPQWALPGAPGRIVAPLRERSAATLSGARNVFCPSEDAQRRISGHFRLNNAVVRVHTEPHRAPDWTPRLPNPGERLRVAVLGAIGIEKGSEVLQRCAADAWKRDLPLDFIVIGFTNNDAPLQELPNVILTGRYAADGLMGLLNRHQPHLCFFPAVWPETFSYTLSIALQCGLFPVAFDLGAIAGRIREVKFGEVIPLSLSTEPERINESLLNCGSALSGIVRPRLPQVRYPDPLLDYYENLIPSPALP